MPASDGVTQQLCHLPSPSARLLLPRGTSRDTHPVSHPSGEESYLHQRLAEHGFNVALAGALNKVFGEGQMGHADQAVSSLQRAWLLLSAQKQS